MATVEYRHRPKPYGQEAVFTLLPDRIDVKQGRRKGAFLYRDLMEMQFTYAPTNIASDGYRTRLLTRQGKTVSFTNLSWKSMAEMERHHAEYRAFAGALAERIARENPQARFWAGLGRIRYGVATALTATSASALCLVVIYGVWRSYVPNETVPPGLPKLLAIMSLVTLAYLAWWMSRYLGRNRPHPCTPATIPETVMPASQA